MHLDWNTYGVVPLVGTWIEMSPKRVTGRDPPVVPLVGTWIEMPLWQPCLTTRPSCPSWARGLKWHNPEQKHEDVVVPLVGQWIEILLFVCYRIYTWTCPSWARGLKYGVTPCGSPRGVVPLVGTWIEMIYRSRRIASPIPSRAPRGHVD